MNAVNYAVQKGCNIVSMSWGMADAGYSNPNSDTIFNKSNVIFLASAGDTVGPSWPSLSRYVVSVGGTSLAMNNSNSRISETGWYTNNQNASGGGTSKSEPINPIQRKYFPRFRRRTTPDVGMVADPKTGFPIINTHYDQNNPIIVGGTSLSCPMWAGIVALVNERRKSILKQPITQSQFFEGIYSATKSPNYSKYFYDVKSGGNPVTPCVLGYDMVSGVGVPKIDDLVIYLSSL